MTATIKPSGRPSASRSRRIRFSSLESLGFTDVAHSWSDSPVVVSEAPRGRHLAPPADPAAVADWEPQEVVSRLNGSNVRWGLVTAVLMFIAGLGALGYWLYQRPAAIELAAEARLTTNAAALETAIPSLTEFSQGMLDADPGAGSGGLDEVENLARALFDTSGSISEVGLRSAGSRAAGSALDGIRLAREAHAYRSAVLPLLDKPQFEADPELIALDEAARVFGSWQLGFDEVRTALPDGVLPGITDELDILSGDLTSLLGRYMDALRNDDQAGAENVLAALGSRLDTVETALAHAIEDIQARVQARAGETLSALQLLSG